MRALQVELRRRSQHSSGWRLSDDRFLSSLATRILLAAKRRKSRKSESVFFAPFALFCGYSGWKTFACGCVALGFCLPWVSGAAERPNILFVYTDDQSHRTLGSYRAEGAHPWVRTPHLDRLAAEGVRFSRAYGASWCAPSRALVLTGLHQHAIRGVDLNRDQKSRRPWATFAAGWDPQRTPMWPSHLRRSGYQTALIGKWHLGQNAGHGLLWDHSVVWDQNAAEGDWYNNVSLSIDGEPAREAPGYATHVYTEFAERFIRRQHDKPWFLWLCYNAPHLPNNTHPDTHRLYTEAEVPTPPDVFGPREGKPEYMRMLTMFSRDDAGEPRMGTTSLKELVRGYNRLVSTIDEGVGRLRAALEETGQLDNTVIVFTSDQGFAWGERGYAWKVGPYDACIRMPLIVRYPPAVAAGGVVREPVHLLDVIPTLLSFTQMPEPWPMHGRNLRTVLRDPTRALGGGVLLEHMLSYFADQITTGVTPETGYTRNIPWWLAWVEGDYKYIQTLVPDEIDELYDLAADPEEQNNLAQQPRHRERVLQMRANLRRALAASDAGFLDTLPAPREPRG